jgi:translation elongation factor EF-G
MEFAIEQNFAIREETYARDEQYLEQQEQEKVEHALYIERMERAKKEFVEQEEEKEEKERKDEEKRQNRIARYRETRENLRLFIMCNLGVDIDDEEQQALYHAHSCQRTCRGRCRTINCIPDHQNPQPVTDEWYDNMKKAEELMSVFVRGRDY